MGAGTKAPSWPGRMGREELGGLAGNAPGRGRGVRERRGYHKHTTDTAGEQINSQQTITGRGLAALPHSANEETESP